MATGSKKDISYFAAGPSKLPDEVIKEIEDDLPFYEDTNLSILEILHSSKEFDKVISSAEDLLRELLNIPENYKILFLQGGGTGQFAAIPMNLIAKTGKADYIVTGLWSRRAARECQKYGTVNFVLPPTSEFTTVPPKDCWNLSSDASFVFYCDNETVDGLEFKMIPDIPEGVPLVCDMSSNLCTRTFDVTKFGVIFAGAQKNIGCAGVTVVIVREDLIGHHRLKECPTVWDFEIMNRNGSRRNTSPTFSIYVLKLCLSWVKKNGGVEAMESNAKRKSQMIYEVIDSSRGFYRNLIDVPYRSRMNVTFRIGDPENDDELEKKFLEEATNEGLLCLKGHRPVHGIRASLYNSITTDDTLRLVTFMKSFMEDDERKTAKS